MAELPKRFFVTIEAPDPQRLRDVFARDLDLFAAHSDDKGHRVDGLITLADAEKLVEAGYRVQISQSGDVRRGHRFIGADEWLRDTRSELERQQKKR